MNNDNEIYEDTLDETSNSEIEKLDTRIKKAKKLLNRAEARKRLLKYRNSKKARNKRTRNLIQIGALTTKYLKLNGYDIEKVEFLLQKIVANEELILKYKTQIQNGKETV